MTSISADEVRVDLTFVDDGYDSAEEADDEDYINMDDACSCDGCQARTDRIAHRVRVPVAPVEQSDLVLLSGTRSLFTDEDELTPPPHYLKRGVPFSRAPSPPPAPVSNGLRLYSRQPLPIGAGRPSRNPGQGQKTINYNVTIPVTPAVDAPVGGFESLSISSSGWESFRFHYTPPVSASWQYTAGASAALRDDDDEVVGGRGMRVGGQRWAY